METNEQKMVLDLSRERLEADLPIGGRIHVHGKDGGYFCEKLPDGTLKETFVPRRQTPTENTHRQSIFSRIRGYFS